MPRFACISLFLLAAALSRVQATPAREAKPAKPAIIDAGREQNIAGVLDVIVMDARVAVRENKDVAELPIIRRQKDWEAWLKKNLCVERIPETNHVRVSFRDGNADEQAAIINVVVNYYLDTDVARRREFHLKAIKSSKAALEDKVRIGLITAEQKAKAEEKLKKYEEDNLRTLPALIESAWAREDSPKK
jgi:hypothetical protein